MLGLYVEIQELGLRKCEDIGSKITLYRIDIYMTNHDLALQYGAKRRWATFYKWALTSSWGGAIIGIEAAPQLAHRSSRASSKKRGKPLSAAEGKGR